MIQVSHVNFVLVYSSRRETSIFVRIFVDRETYKQDDIISLEMDKKTPLLRSDFLLYWLAREFSCPLSIS